MTKTCAYCAAAIPRERRRSSRYCSEDHRQAYKREALSSDRSFRPGPKLFAIRSGDHVFVAVSGALRSRLRLALAGMAPGAQLVGALPVEGPEAIDTFKIQHGAAHVSGSWFRADCAILAHFGADAAESEAA
jgi:hypothetical protein